MSKNVADFTDFNGKTFKKITQAPGGTSTFSIGWSNEKTDYGPDRNIKKRNDFQSDARPTQYGRSSNQCTITQPIKVMSMQQDEQRNYGKTKLLQQVNYNSKISPIMPPVYPSEAQKNQNIGRTCVKIVVQKSNLSLGDDNYNYWKDTGKQTKNTQQAVKRQEQVNVPEKTSVKVQKPPGGRSTFIFG